MHTTESESAIARHRDDSPHHPVVTVIDHPDPGVVGARQPLSHGAVTAGRSADGTLLPGVFDLRKVSREHLRIERRGERVVARDLGSRNGSYRNGQPLEEATLEEGDVLQVGRVVLLFHRGPRSFSEPAQGRLIGKSWAMAQLLDAIDEASAQRTNVMIVGETGTGKELVAEAIHERGGAPGAFVALNCGGLAEGVLHSELFGHTRGAFSGAVSARSGLIAEASEGTLFLDEIGAAPPGFQSALLRVLETDEYRVVGASETSRATARFVAATHPEVEQAVARGAFRSDLWYRLARRLIRVPPLRKRREDILSLVRHHAESIGHERIEMSSGLAAALVRHDWPGNVRELLAVTERLVSAAVARDETMTMPAWLERELEASRRRSRERPASSQEPPSSSPGRPTRRRRRPSRESLVTCMTRHQGSVAHASRALGVDRKTLYRWLSALDIDLETLRESP